ncbi:MAG TPA: alpha/beta fold hydrolase [Candidatus Binataceae bacterium]|nr:alpha/beta fold hydrolase [Candidatus Binataceae bacterium]
MSDAKRPQVSATRITGQRSFIAQSLAPDCRTLALVSDQGGAGVFAVFLYDLKLKQLRELSSTTGPDEGDPVFAPSGQLLAYLSGARLALFDYAQSKPISVPSSASRFRSVAWADDGRSVFMEDERFDIWQYDIQPQQFRRIWRAPKEGFFRRMLSEKQGHLLFTSDHESSFRQIYSLDLKSGDTKRIYPSDHDQFSPLALGNKEYTFRSDFDENFIAFKLAGGESQARSPLTGVTYDFSLDFGPPLLFYASDEHPLGFFWFEGKDLKPLLTSRVNFHQPPAIPIKNSRGMTNFLYLPGKEPKALLIWLHGGPHEQVSPRYDLYFDFLLHHDIAVYAINYPGSTGIGSDYSLSNLSDDAQAIPIQVHAVQEDIRELDRVRPIHVPRIIVGVSYGSIVAHRVAAANPEFQNLIDFSGIADLTTVPEPANVPSVLFIYGINDEFSRAPARLALLDRYQHSSRLSKLVLPDEGHYIGRRDSIDLILRAIEKFLRTPEKSAQAR